VAFFVRECEKRVILMNKSFCNVRKYEKLKVKKYKEKTI